MKIGVLFPGYGSQYIGMAKELYDDSRIIQEYFEEASQCLDTNFVKLCFASSDTELSRPDHAYTALFLVSSALYAVLKSQGVTPWRIAGYNQGEFSAIHAASGFTFPDGLYLLSKYATLYGQLLSTHDANGIRVCGVPFEPLNSLCQKISKPDRLVHIALQNLPQEHIVMGHPAAIELVRERVIEYSDAEIFDADVELGLHAPCMEPVVAGLKTYSEKVDFKDLSIPLVTNAQAALVTEGSDVKIGLMQQIESMVRWSDSMAQFSEADLIIEVGPGSHLTALAKKIYPDKLCISLNTNEDFNELARLLQPLETQQEL
ncbi:ACP S-malonyltransferase [Candidatus Dependentiae bacterium]|nr:ACP S-malonyltransferase [Candidatus Dependentiae bacterium]MCC7414964.1 ACP S-malonyltransferase [Campylobacterota bacterium]